MDLKVVAHFSNGIDGTQVFAFLANQQLHHRVTGVFCELQWIVVLRHDGRLVQPEHGLDPATPRQEIARAVDKLFQNPARVLHDFQWIGRRMNIGTAYVEAAHERVQQLRGVDALFLLLARLLCKGIRLIVHSSAARLRFLFHRCAAKKRPLEFLVAGHFLFVQ